MSRSIHKTRRDYEREINFDYSDDECKERSVSEIRKSLRKKRIIKMQKKEERKFSGTLPDPAPLSLDAIPIHYKDENDFVRFPVQKEDVLNIAKYLPADVFNGLASITFCLGKEFMDEESEESEEEKRDPYTGRISSELIKKIYTPPCLGCYYSYDNTIYVFAYVYKDSSMELDVLLPYLRLQMMSTLIHEIAHHDDYMRRMGRGRWMGLNKGKVEDYAEFLQWKWAESAIVPCLLDKYPNEYAKLSSWIKEYGGVDFPLAVLAGESFGYEVDGMTKMVFPASSGLENLFQNIIDGKSHRDALIEFAEDLHFADHYEECLISLDSLLSENENDDKALGIKADTFIHQEKYDKAELTANKCLTINPDNIDALDSLCDVFMERKDWKSLLDASKRGIKAAGDSDNFKYEKKRFIESQIIASIFFGDFSNAEKILGLLPDDVAPFAQFKVALRALLAFLKKDFKTAMELAENELRKERVFIPNKGILKAVYNAVVRKLDTGKEIKELAEHEQNYLSYKRIDELLK